MIRLFERLREEAGVGEGGGGAPPANPPPDARDAEIARLRAALTNPPPNPNPPAQPPPVDMKALETTFWKDPLNMSAAIAQQAAVNAQVNSGSFETLVEVAKKSARGDDPARQKLFDKYEKDIVAKVQNSVQPQFYANVNVWRHAFNFVLGEKHDEIHGVRQQEENRAPAVHIPDGPGVPSTRAPGAPSKIKLTEEQRHWAKNFGLTEDQYRKGIQIREDQRDRPDQDSSWDEVVTVDSVRQKRNKGGKAA